MAKKTYTFKDVDKILTKMDCILIWKSILDCNKRVKVRDKILYIDPNGHENEKPLRKLLAGIVGCNECKKKYDIEEIKSIFSKQGCILLTNEYIHSKKQKLYYICPNGHECTTNLYNFTHRKSYECEDCRKEQYTIEIRENAIKRNCLIIELKYENQNSIVEYKCPRGHHCSQRAENFLNELDCLECQGRKKYSIAKIRKEFEKNSCILLANEYINAHTTMEFLCKCGRRDYKSWHTFRKGRFYCRGCRFERYNHPRQLSQKEVSLIFAKEGCKLLSTEYKSQTDYLGYICKCGNYDAKSLILFRRGYRCEDCEKERIRGEYTHNNLKQYLRNVIKAWIYDSYNEYGGKCAISGEKANHIHHIYSFYKIVDETFVELKLPKYECSSKYTEDQLLKIKEKILDLHYKYGLGIPLSAKIHRLLHSLYGINVNDKDFLRFRKGYQLFINDHAKE